MGWNIFSGVLINAWGRGAEGSKTLIYQCRREGGEQAERVEDYQVGPLCWLSIQPESKLQQEPDNTGLRGDELYRPISSQKLIPYQPAPERVWGAEAKARGDGRKERLAWGQLWKKLISSTDYPQAGVTHDERSHTKRIKSFCQQLSQVEMKDGMTDGGEEER